MRIKLIKLAVSVGLLLFGLCGVNSSDKYNVTIWYSEQGVSCRTNGEIKLYNNFQLVEILSEGERTELTIDAKSSICIKYYNSCTGKKDEICYDIDKDNMKICFNCGS